MENALIAAAGDLANGGFPRRAEDIARSLRSEAARRQALAGITAGWSAAGSPDRARVIAQEVTDLARRAVIALDTGARAAATPTDAARVLGPAVSAWAGAGDAARAAAIAEEMEGYLGTATDAYDKDFLLLNVARAWLAAGNPDQANGLVRRLTDDCQPMAQDRIGPAISDVARVYARAGQVVRAEQMAREITSSDPDEQAQAQVNALVTVVMAWAESGDLGGAYAVAQQVEELARTVAWPRDRANALTSAARAWVGLGINARGEALAREAADLARTVNDVPKQTLIADPGADPAQLAEVHAAMAALAAARDRPPAEAHLLRAAVPAAARLGHASKAEAFSQRITHGPSREWACSAAARMTSWETLPLRQSDPATVLADSILTTQPSAWLVEDVAWTGAGIGSDKDVKRTRAFLTWLIGRAMELWTIQAGSALVPQDQAASLALRAEEIALLASPRTPSDDGSQTRTRIDNICSSALPGNFDRAYALTRAILAPDDRAWGLAGAARAWVTRDFTFGAQELLIENLDATFRAGFLALAASGWMRSGHSEQARGAASKAEQCARDLRPQVSSPAARTLLFAIAASAWANATDTKRARNLAAETANLAEEIRIPDDRSIDVHRAWALSDAALAWLVAGDPDRALATAGAIKDKKKRAAALVHMAHNTTPQHATPSSPTPCEPAPTDGHWR